MDDHVGANRARWDADAENWLVPGRERWADDRIRWGIWDVPEEELRLLPDVDGLDVVELGCGTGYFSSWRAAHRVPYNLCGSQVLFGMLGQIEHIDLAALIAPRALLVESGRDDFLFPIESATESMTELAAVYAAMRAPIHSHEHHVFDGGHRWDGATALAFMDRWL